MCHLTTLFRPISGAKIGMSSKNGHFIVEVEYLTRTPRVLFIETETKQNKQPENGQDIWEVQKVFIFVFRKGLFTYQANLSLTWEHNLTDSFCKLCLLWTAVYRPDKCWLSSATLKLERICFFYKESSVQTGSCHFTAFKGNYILDPGN